MPRGIEPTAPTSSVNPAVPASSRGIGAAPSDAVVFGTPVGRGVTVTTSEPGGTLPR